MINMEATVAITGMNARPDNPGPGLAVARCLRESQYFSGRIVGLSYDALDPGMYLDQYCDAVWMLPFPSSSSSEYLQRLQEIHGQENFHYLIPCLDVELPVIARSRSQLRQWGVNTCVPEPRQLRLRNKDNLAELARLSGLDTPRSELISNADFFQDCEDDGWTWPLVVKGIYYDARIVSAADEAREVFQDIAAHWGYPVIVQELVKGDEYNLSAIGDGQGRLLSPVMMKKLATTDRGKAWAGITIEDSKLLEASRRLSAALDWLGPLEVEVIRDDRGNYQLIEINPRFPAWIYLSAGSGNNLPEILLRLMAGEPLETGSPAAAGMMYIRYAADTVAPIGRFESLMMQGMHKVSPGNES